jgi:hypothetical protein
VSRPWAWGADQKRVDKMSSLFQSRPWAWGADADQGVTLKGSKADDIVVTRATPLLGKMSRSPPPLVTIPTTFRSWTLPSGADVAPPGA